MSVELALSIVVGLALGSFGNVLIARVPEGQGIGGRSRCPQCKTPIAPYDLVPVLSYVALVGKCRRCGMRISPQYPLVEVLGAALFAYACIFTGERLWYGLLLGTILWIFLIIAAIDVRTRGIPDALSIPLIILCGVYQWVTQGMVNLSGAGIFVLWFGGQWLLSRGRWVGSGDILLGIAMGLLFGSIGLSLIALFLSYIVGAVIISVLLITGTVQRKSVIPFGPFLALSTLLTLAFGERILQLLLW